MRKDYKICFLSGFLVLLTGCGYSFVTSSSSLGEKTPVVSVSVKDTVSTVPEFSWFLADQIKTGLMRNYGFRIGEKERSDYGLDIEVIKINRESSGYTTKGIIVNQKEYPYPLLATAYLSILFSIKLYDLRSNDVLWAEPRLYEKELYQISEDPLKNDYNLKQAISKISERLVILIYSTGFTRF